MLIKLRVNYLYINIFLLLLSYYNNKPQYSILQCFQLKEMSAALVENGSELERAIRDKLSAVSEYNKVKERSIISDGQHAEVYYI